MGEGLPTTASGQFQPMGGRSGRAPSGPGVCFRPLGSRVAEFGPLSRLRERVGVRGGHKRRVLKIDPHPALRATFSRRREKDSPTTAMGRRRSFDSRSGGRQAQIIAATSGCGKRSDPEFAGPAPSSSREALRRCRETTGIARGWRAPGELEAAVPRRPCPRTCSCSVLRSTGGFLARDQTAL